MLALFLSLLLVGAQDIEIPRLTAEDLVFPAGPDCGMPDLARGPDGTIFATWLEHGASSQSATLWLACLKDGAWGEPRRVRSGDDWFVNWVDVPRVAALQDGTLLVSWLQRNGGGTYAYGVRFAVSRDGGETWTDDAWLHDDASATEHGFVSLTALDDTRFLAVWLDGRNTGGQGHDGHGSGAMSLRSREIKVSDDEVSLGEEAVVDDRVCDCCPTALVGSSEDGVACLYRDRSPEEVRDISYAFYGDGAWTAPGNLHEDRWVIDGCPVNGPSLARRGEHLAAAWFTGTGEGGGSVFVTVSGRKGFEAPLDVDEGAPAGRVSLCFLEDDSLLVTWLEHEEGRAAWRARRLVLEDERLVLEPSIAIEEVNSSRKSGVGRLIREVSADADTPSAIFAWTSTSPPHSIATVRLLLNQTIEPAPAR